MDGRDEQLARRYSEMDAEIAAAVINAEIGDLEETYVLQKAEAAQKEFEASQTKADIAANRRLLESIGRKIVARNCSMSEDTSEAISIVACGGATADDIIDCKFQHQAFRRIAEINNGEIILKTAADLVFAVMNPRGTKNSVLVAQRRRMKFDSDWERVGRGVYRLTGFSQSEVGPKPSETPTLDVVESPSIEETDGEQHAA